MNAPHAANWVAQLRHLAQLSAVLPMRCELCGAGLGGGHAHLLDVDAGQLVCSCDACTALFPAHADGRLRPIPQRVRRLDGLRFDDRTWNALQLPIGLAWFARCSRAGRVQASYPGPAGVTVSRLPLDRWQELVAHNPSLGDMADDVEALLVDRSGHDNVCFLVPIDYCFALTGLIRRHWQGVTGGSACRRAIDDFFHDLQQAPDRLEVRRHA